MSIMQGLPKILLIEDDRGIANALKQALSISYIIDAVPTGKQGIYNSDRDDYAAVILDLNLPDMPGHDVCQQLRERGLTVPILIITAENKVLTKITLLDAGADDYLTKPFSLGELKARLRVLDRRHRKQPLKPAQLIVGDLELNTSTYKVQRQGQSIQLRRKEFSLLTCLMERAGTVVKRETLMRYGWQGQEEPWTNTVDVHIKYLRDKIDRPFNHKLIRTVHGIGYRLEISHNTAKQEVKSASR